MKLSTSALALALAASFGLTSMAFAQTTNSAATPATPAKPAAASSAKTDKTDKSHKTVQHKTRTEKSSADAKTGAGEAVKK